MRIMNFYSDNIIMFYIAFTTTCKQIIKNLPHRILNLIYLIKKTIIMCIILTFPYYILAKDIETYMKDSQCSNVENSLCDSIENLKQALAILTKIQNHNFALMQKKEANAKKEKDITSKSDTQKKEAKDLQKEDITIVTYTEYQLLKQYMKRFCKSFKNLKNEEKQILFTLQWNKNPIFQNNDDVIRFCKSKH